MRFRRLGGMRLEREDDEAKLQRFAIKKTDLMNALTVVGSCPQSAPQSIT